MVVTLIFYCLLECRREAESREVCHGIRPPRFPRGKSLNVSPHRRNSLTRANCCHRSISDMDRRRVYGQACAFCAKRKIKCSGVYPCDNCAKRGRGDSCTAQRPTAPEGDGERHRPSHNTERRDDIPTNRAHSDGSHRRHDVPPAADAGGQGATQDQSSRNPDYSGPTSTCSPSQLGANSMPSFINAAARSRHTHFTQSIRPALGLENAATSYPFMAGNQASGTEESHFNVASSHAEVLKYAPMRPKLILIY